MGPNSAFKVLYTFHGNGTNDLHFESFDKDIYLDTVINTGPNLTAVTFQQAHTIFIFTISLESNYV
jgi:hypothetical protein